MANEQNSIQFNDAVFNQMIDFINKSPVYKIEPANINNKSISYQIKGLLGYLFFENFKTSSADRIYIVLEGENGSVIDIKGYNNDSIVKYAQRTELEKQLRYRAQQTALEEKVMKFLKREYVR